MRNIKITVEYDGTDYSGWQRQANGPRATIQQKLEEAILKVTGAHSAVHGSGRTDAGVHALGQVANFSTSSVMKSDTLLKALNSELPEDIAVKSADDAPPEFHARVSAKKKTYFYRILNRPSRAAVERKTCWFIPARLDVKAMKAACELIPGEHDFKAFCHADTKTRNTVRTVFSATLKRRGGFIVFFIEADGFLKRMVRLMVGTLVSVGRGKTDPDEFGRILKTGEKTGDVTAAPPQGLFLEKVIY